MHKDQKIFPAEKKKHSYLYQRHVTEVQPEQVISGLKRGEKETCGCMTRLHPE